MVEEIRLKDLENITNRPKLPHGIYFIWFFGFMCSFSLLIALYNLFKGNYFFFALFLFNSFFFLPPLGKDHFLKLMKIYDKFNKK